MSSAEKKYYELTKSKDPKTKGFADRYMNLLKFQEWGTASGKSVMAKYISHDANMSKVKLAVNRGTGKERVLKEYDVDVTALNKVCQSRIKQIDVLQKKLDEMAATAGQQNPGSPMVDERGVIPGAPAGPETVAVGPGETPGGVPAATSPPTPEVDPSASEPDPLGFAELPPIAAAAGPGPGGVPAGGIPAGPGLSDAAPSPGGLPPGVSIPAPPAEANAGEIQTGPPKAWQTDYEEFRKMFTVYPVGPGQATPPPDRKLIRVEYRDKEATEWDIDFGDLEDLRLMAEEALVFNERRTGAPTKRSRAEADQIVKASDAARKRIGEVTWVATFRGFYGAGQPIGFELAKLPKPMSIVFMLNPKDPRSMPDQWKAFARGDRIQFRGRPYLTIGPADIYIEVREPQKVGVSSEPAK
jgi:hypothetical protein